MIGLLILVIAFLGILTGWYMDQKGVNRRFLEIFGSIVSILTIVGFVLLFSEIVTK